MQETITHILTPFLNPNHPLKIEKLAGQASSREYFRVKNDTQSWIVMKMPAGASSVAEEITKTTSDIKELPFINIQKYLISLGLPVPKIIGEKLGEGILVLEDLGDTTFENAILENKSLMETWYQKALLLLGVLQKKTTDSKQTCLAHSRQFDADLLFWEFNHFIEYGLEDRLGKKIDANDKHQLESLGKELVDEISKLPTGLTHRDYQSRNLMVYNNGLFFIDFQDALIGPVVYDLVGLLRDSYIEIPKPVLQNLLLFFSENTDKTNPYYKQPNLLKKDFYLMTIQRKLKDSGRFQYIKTVKNNPSFLPHVPLSLSYVKDAINETPKYADIGKIIAKYLPEFR